MTDSKTPDWVKGETSDLYDLVSDATSTAHAKAEISQALLSAYERGRKEGIEEAAKVAASGKVHTYTVTGYPLTIRPMQYGGLIATAIRQLLEVKG